MLPGPGVLRPLRMDIAWGTLPDCPAGTESHMAEWLELGRDAMLPIEPSPEVLRRTEQRAVML